MECLALEDVCTRVTEVIVESLELESEDSFPLTTNLVDDLEAESLDFLDIVFRLEKAFSIKIERGKMEKELRRRFPELKLKPNTPLDEELRAALVEMMPEVPVEEVQALGKLKEAARRFRIATFVRLTVQSLQEKGIGIQADSPVPGGDYTVEQLGVVAALPR